MDRLERGKREPVCSLSVRFRLARVLRRTVSNSKERCWERGFSLACGKRVEWSSRFCRLGKKARITRPSRVSGECGRASAGEAGQQAGQQTGQWQFGAAGGGRVERRRTSTRSTSTEYSEKKATTKRRSGKGGKNRIRPVGLMMELNLDCL